MLACSPDRETATRPAPEPVESSTAPIVETRSPEDVVKEFGRRMQLVPTTASPDIAAKAMREHYGGLVHPTLLEKWAAAPADAPGRAVSSPWPDRIEVGSSSLSGDRATVIGEVVEVTSAGEAQRVPIEVGLARSNGAWLITEYRVKDDVAAVVRDYYDAIAARDYERAYRYWLAPAQSLDDFTKGFADTASVEVKAGAPSRIEGAAGSQYVDVPVTITATTKSGRSQRFEGTYTLRRSMVEGGEKRWRIDRASIRERR